MELISIGKFAKIVGVTTVTLRRMHEKGELIPCYISKGGTRYYSSEQLRYFLGHDENKPVQKIVGYCRVVSDDFSDDLEQQRNNLKTYMCAKGYQFSLIEDIGSGIDYNRKGFLDIITAVNRKEISKIVILYRDILTEFGFEFIEYLCKINNVDIEIIDDTGRTCRQILINDMIDIAAEFAGQKDIHSEETMKFIDSVKADLCKNT